MHARHIHKASIISGFTLIQVQEAELYSTHGNNVFCLLDLTASIGNLAIKLTV